MYYLHLKFIDFYKNKGVKKIKSIMVGYLEFRTNEFMLIYYSLSGLYACYCLFLQAAALMGKKVAVFDFVKPTPIGTTWGKS